ncbi:hypothetical protein HK096_006610, partial [Nowakowskiella sp. JEL0078]
PTPPLLAVHQLLVNFLVPRIVKPEQHFLTVTRSKFLRYMVFIKTADRVPCNYIAISHFWHVRTPSGEKIFGHPYYLAKTAIEESWKSSTENYWYDRISIDQTNPAAVSAAVNEMDAVYSDAYNVLVFWTSEEHELLKEFVDKYGSISIKEYLNITVFLPPKIIILGLFDDLTTLVKRLCKLTYNTRAWTLNEKILGAESLFVMHIAEFVCDAKQSGLISAKEMHDLFTLLSFFQPRKVLAYKMQLNDGEVYEDKLRLEAFMTDPSIRHAELQKDLFFSSYRLLCFRDLFIDYDTDLDTAYDLLSCYLAKKGYYSPGNNKTLADRGCSYPIRMNMIYDFKFSIGNVFATQTILGCLIGYSVNIENYSRDTFGYSSSNIMDVSDPLHWEVFEVFELLSVIVVDEIGRFDNLTYSLLRHRGFHIIQKLVKYLLHIQPRNRLYIISADLDTAITKDAEFAILSVIFGVEFSPFNISFSDIVSVAVATTLRVTYYFQNFDYVYVMHARHKTHCNSAFNENSDYLYISIAKPSQGDVIIHNPTPTLYSHDLTHIASKMCLFSVSEHFKEHNLRLKSCTLNVYETNFMCDIHAQ